MRDVALRALHLGAVLGLFAATAPSCGCGPAPKPVEVVLEATSVSQGGCDFAAGVTVQLLRALCGEPKTRWVQDKYPGVEFWRYCEDSACNRVVLVAFDHGARVDWLGAREIRR